MEVYKLDKENFKLYMDGKMQLGDMFKCNNCGELYSPHNYIDCPYCGIHYLSMGKNLDMESMK